MTKEERQRERLARYREYASGLNMPITFAGKVVDQDGQPLQGAKITIELRAMEVPGQPDIAPKKMRTKLTALTNPGGVFRFERLQGYLVRVDSVEKPGYEYKENLDEWLYDRARLLKAESAPAEHKPPVFVLRKRMPGTFLLKFGGGFRCQAELTQTALDFLAPQRVDYQLVPPPSSSRKPDIIDVQIDVARSQTDEECSVTFRAGKEESDGLVLSEKVLYEAPADGYTKEAVVVVDMSGSDTKTVYLYVKSRAPVVHTRLRVEMKPRPSGLVFRYGGSLNPYGERGLELEPEITHGVKRAVKAQARKHLRERRYPEKPDLAKLIAEDKARMASRPKKRPTTKPTTRPAVP